MDSDIKAKLSYRYSRRLSFVTKGMKDIERAHRTVCKS